MAALWDMLTDGAPGEAMELDLLGRRLGCETALDLLVRDAVHLGSDDAVAGVDDDVDVVVKGQVSRDLPEAQRRLNDRELGWVAALETQGRLEKKFNRYFFTNGDSRDPELAGIWSATVGSFFMLLVTLALSFPIGVATAIYLEEFAPRNRWTDLVEVNINNLAAVPSIVFGLLGLALFINMFGLPRSAPMVGGLVLSLMTLPVIITSTREALSSVPMAFREACWNMGATRWQTFRHVILPILLPALLTGFTLAFARGVGEYGSVIFIAGNMPMISEITPLLIITKLEQYDYAGATAIATVMLALSFVLLLVINGLQAWQARRNGADGFRPGVVR